MKWDAEKYDSVKAPQIDAGRELVAMANVRDSNSILDIGCGTGKLTIELARPAPKGNVVGIDPSGLRPYLEKPPEREQEYFKYAFAMSFENNRTKWGIEFDFRRLFAFAEK